MNVITENIYLIKMNLPFHQQQDVAHHHLTDKCNAEVVLVWSQCIQRDMAILKGGVNCFNKPCDVVVKKLHQPICDILWENQYIKKI